jgi:hypothetical protein
MLPNPYNSVPAVPNNYHPTTPRVPGSRSVTAPSTVPQAAQDHASAFPPTSPSVYAAPGYGISTPVLPSEMDGTSPNRSPFQAPNQMSPVTRSADNSPFPHIPHTPPHHPGSPHYGNRNLSPLFKASRADSARRPSTLRQEISPTSPNPGVQIPGNRHSPSRQSAGATALSYLQSQI